MPTQAEIVARIVAALALTEPDLDLSVGSLPRKMIDAVALPISETTTEAHLVNYQYDIDSKTGPALDDFVRLFGLERIGAQRATGIISFSRSATVAAKGAARIPIGTQVAARGSIKVSVQTIVSAVLDKDQTSIDVPVRALISGTVGNVGANTLTNLVTPLANVTVAKNYQALVGGTNAETDSQLRARFKSTVFRNIAGTEHMYSAMALQFSADPSDASSRPVSRANVLGPSKRWVEQLSITGGAASSTITDAVYLYPSSIFVTAPDGSVLRDADYDYTIDAFTDSGTNTGRVRLSLTGLDGSDGDIYSIRFDYVSYYSRNDPLGSRFGSGVGVNNRVDIWINGEVGKTATASPKFVNTTKLQFNDTAGSSLYRRRYSTLSGAHPAINDVFIPLGFSPVIGVPNTITIGPNTYTEGTHYDIVHQSDAFGYGPSSRAGLVWYMAHGAPSSTNLGSISYVYNSIPGLLEDRIATQWRLLGTDVRVHAGRPVSYRVHLAVVYDARYTASSVNAAITTKLRSFVAGLGFNSALQVSDLLQQIHNVPGVDNVRFLTSTDDATNYGIQVINSDGTPGAVISSGGRAKDVYFDDATYPVFDSIRVIAKAKNTFGTS